MPTGRLTLDATVRLNNGVDMPRFGLGVWQIPRGEPTRNAVTFALAAGYRLIDTAHLYRNEADVGAAVRASGVPRERLFVTTKLWNDDHGYDRALRAFDRSLRALGLEYVDLYLIHWPVPEVRLESWRALERLLEEGRSRAIGVSNFTERHLDELFTRARVVPAVNQVELSPFLQQRALVDFCRGWEIQVEAYSPLTKGRHLHHPVVTDVARRHRKTPAQVLIRWALQHDLVVIPKSARAEHIRENAHVFDFELAPDDLARLDALDQGLRTAWDPTSLP